MSRLLMSIAVGCFVAASSLAAAEPKKVALLVGVNQYDKRGFRPLAFAERDVDELGKMLRRSGYEVTTLTGGGDGDHRATLANMQKQLDRALTGRNQVDMVLIGLAGHGFQIDVDAGGGARQADAFFCPVDAEKGNHRTMFSIGGLLDELDRRGGGTNLLLVDACREDPTRGRGLDGSTVKTLPEGTAVLFGCRAGQKTFESANAGGGHGVFFHFVIEGLSGKAVNERGEVTWSRLAEYVTERVFADTPTLLDDVHATQVPNDLRNLPGISPVLAKLEFSVPPPKNTPVPMPQPPALPVPASLQSTTNSVGMKLILIPAGEFQMGSPSYDSDAQDDEKPQHKVRNTKPFYLGQTEVTRGQFAAFVAAENYRTEAERDGKGGFGFTAEGNWEQKPEFNWRNPGFTQTDEHPVVNVSHNDAVAFCEWLSAKDGKTYRLPTEAEWEYACRAGTTTKYYHGNDPEGLAAIGNTADASVKGKFPGWAITINANDGSGYTAPVGRFKPNAWGLHDMTGNVWEWCYDWYEEGFYKTSPVDDPWGAAAGSFRVIRGGCWGNNASRCRSASRGSGTPSDRSSITGLRVVLVP